MMMMKLHTYTPEEGTRWHEHDAWIENRDYILCYVPTSTNHITLCCAIHSNSKIYAWLNL